MSDASASDTQRGGPFGAAAIAVIATFVLAALPFAVWQVISQADEARYTVAAARMMASGDYIIPYSAWGEVRLLKPPLVYYQVVAGFALFGQSVFAVKSIWVLSGAVVLALTWALARGAGAGRAGAAVAVAALAANPIFFQGALTHNPDLPMVLGIALASVGFLRILEDETPPPWAAWAAWLGVAWAFLAKGLLVLLLVALAMGLRAFWGRRLVAGRNEVAALVVSLVAAGWWWVAVAIREPEALMAQFFGDQMGERSAFDPSGIVVAFVWFVAFMVIGFLPMLLAAMPAAGLKRPQRGKAVIFLAAWAALVPIVFAFGIYHPARYVLPALPALAALIGVAFDQLEPHEIARRAGRAVRLLLMVTLAVVAVAAAIVYGGAPVLAALGALAGGVGVVALIWWLAGRGRVWLALPLLSVWLPVTVLLTYPAARVIAFPAAADHGVEAVRASGLPTDKVVIFGKWRFLDRVGLRAPPIEGYRYSSPFREDMLEGAGMVLTIDPRHAERLKALGWEVREETGAPEAFGPGDLWAAIRARDIAGLREAFGEKIYIATRP
jgi:4-amino-4-deoxy-L-arabinose transferase-like glycosyltransferase